MAEAVPGRFELDHGARGAAPLLRCGALERPGVRHGFGTRLGAASVTSSTGAEASASAEGPQQHLGAVAAAVGVAADALFRVRQVHGAGVVTVPAGGKACDLAVIEADALITDRPGTAVAVSTADCVPVLFADARRGVVAAVHAGWRGLAGGVLEATLDRLVAGWGCRPEELVVVAGPAIGREAYEVGEEVVAALGHLAGAWWRPSPDRRPHLDLRAAAGELLRGRGVRQYTASTHCTRSEAALFYSYRREGSATGRQLNVIGLVAQP